MEPSGFHFQFQYDQKDFKLFVAEKSGKIGPGLSVKVISKDRMEPLTEEVGRIQAALVDRLGKAQDLSKTAIIDSLTGIGATSIKTKEDSVQVALDGYIDKLKQSEFFSGVVLVARGDEVLRHEAISPASQRQEKFTKDTPFNVLSVGKLFTATAIMQLVEEGKLSLSDSIGAHLKDADYLLSDADPIYRNDMLPEEEIEKLKSAVSDGKITMQHLLTHTAGIIERPRPLRAYFDVNMVGSKAYSNIGCQLLAEVIRNRTNQPFQEYICEHVFKKAGMEEAIKYTMSPPKPEEQPKQFDNSRPSGTPIARNDRVPAPHGNGCWWMPASDLLKFAQAFDANLFFTQPKMREKMLTPDPQFDNNTLEFGIHVTEDPEHPRIWGHFGGMPGLSSSIHSIEGEPAFAIVILSNYKNGNFAGNELCETILGKGPPRPFDIDERLKERYQKLASVDPHDLESISKQLIGLSSDEIEVIVNELEASGKESLAKAISEVREKL